MMNRKTFLEKYPTVQEGMTARTLDGEKLGKVSAMNDDSFAVQKGFFFPKDFLLRYEDIQDIRDGELILNVNQSDLSEWRDESYAGWNQVNDINTGRLAPQPRDEYRDRYRAGATTTEETRIPVMEEELRAQKQARQTGQIQLRKIVHTELKHFTVPVTREEVRIERVPGGRATAAENLKPGEAFQEKTVNIPVMEEEVTVTKTPRVKEEIRVTKERRQEEREVSGEIHREELKVEGEDALKKKKTA